MSTLDARTNVLTAFAGELAIVMNASTSALNSLTILIEINVRFFRRLPLAGVGISLALKTSGFIPVVQEEEEEKI
jgi:hypothetical protein